MTCMFTFCLLLFVDLVAVCKVKFNCTNLQRGDVVVYISIVMCELCNQSVICREVTKGSQGCIEVARYDHAVQTCTQVCELWDLWPKKAVLLMYSLSFLYFNAVPPHVFKPPWLSPVEENPFA